MRGRNSHMGNFSKIIWILQRKHMEDRDWITYGCDVITGKGYDVELWCLVNWEFSDKTIEDPRRMYTGKEVKYINGKKEFKNAVSKIDIKNTYFIFYPGYGEATIGIGTFTRKVIKHRGGKYSNYYYSPSPSYKEYKINNFSEALQFYFNNYIKKHKFTGTIKEITKILTSAIFPSDYDFIPTKLSYSHLPNKFDTYKKKAVLLHSSDYDYILRNDDKEVIVEGKYIVFVDSFWIGHSDLIKIFGKWEVDEEKYFSEINAFFKKLEDTYGYKVVIALHPKAEYKGNPFKGREMYAYVTENLIKHAEFCILESSTSIDFILYYGKEYFQIISSELYRNKYSKSEIYSLQTYLDSRIIRLDMIEDGNIALDEYLNHYDKDKYEKYLEFYMNPHSHSDKLNIEVILDYIENF